MSAVAYSRGHTSSGVLNGNTKSTKADLKH